MPWKLTLARFCMIDRKLLAKQRSKRSQVKLRRKQESLQSERQTRRSSRSIVLQG